MRAQQFGRLPNRRSPQKNRRLGCDAVRPLSNHQLGMVSCDIKSIVATSCRAKRSKGVATAPEGLATLLKDLPKIRNFLTYIDPRVFVPVPFHIPKRC